VRPERDLKLSLEKEINHEKHLVGEFVGTYTSKKPDW
jgi:hypothetical protein